MTSEDWRAIAISLGIGIAVFLAGAAWGYALCRLRSDRMFRRWMATYSHGVPKVKQVKPAVLQPKPPAKRQKAHHPKGGIPLKGASDE